MSFFDDASLVMIPSGYKDQKVYSVKPTDGTGDLTFTRASDATRVASDGLIEKVRTNLILYSEQFDNAAWGKTTSATVTANNVTSPDGTLNADTLNAGANGSQIQQTITGTIGTVYTVSMYIKRISGVGTVNLRAVENTNTPITVTSEWTRVSLTVTATTTTIRSGVTLAVSGNEVAIWGAQVEVSDFGATDYIATTTAAVSVGPVSGLPRLDYLDSTCPRLLLEPQRTNLVFFSEQLNDAGWAGSAVVTANTAVSPDGFTNADSVMEAAVNDYHIIGDAVTTTSATAYTFSFFAKPNGRNVARVLFSNGSFPDYQSAYFNLLTGAVIASASVAASMVSYGNGWYRCIATITSDASASSPSYLGPARNMTDSYSTYPGNVSLGIYAFGVQQEAGAYATSYIPTLGAAVTRVADASYKTGISSLIGQTEGTIFFEINSSNFESYTQRIFTASDDTNNNVVGLQLTGSNEIVFYVENGGVNQVAITKATPAITLGQNVKVAAAYKANDFVLYVGGVQVGTDSSGGVPATSVLRYANPTGNAPYIGKVVQTLLFTTRLTNAQLAELTA